MHIEPQTTTTELLAVFDPEAETITIRPAHWPDADPLVLDLPSEQFDGDPVAVLFDPEG